MSTILRLLTNNRQWVASQLSKNPKVFKDLAKGQAPSSMVIACSDSRVSPNIITHSNVGDLFVHRNVANIVQEDDKSMMAFLDYGIHHLKIDHIIVCGHTKCGGITGAFKGNTDGSIKAWVDPVRQLYLRNKEAIDSSCHTEEAKIDTLALLSLHRSITIIKNLPNLQSAFKGDPAPQIHGWMFDVKTGTIKSV